MTYSIKALYVLGLGILRVYLLHCVPARPLGSCGNDLSPGSICGQEEDIVSAAPQLWNTVPSDICLALSLYSFKRCVKTEPNRWAFNTFPWFNFIFPHVFKTMYTFIPM